MSDDAPQPIRQLSELEIDNLIEAHRDDAIHGIEDHFEVHSALSQMRHEIRISDQLIAERDRILDALPCPIHGRCVPFVLEWIERKKKLEG